MKVSIITINYNNFIGLKKTINSIGKQIDMQENDFEYIVVDGLSKDGSVELIEKSDITKKAHSNNEMCLIIINDLLLIACLRHHNVSGNSI